MKDRACVFVGPFEHHSNLLSELEEASSWSSQCLQFPTLSHTHPYPHPAVWQETSALVIEIPLNPLTGTLCLPTLQRQLTIAKNVRGQTQLIGSFSAASNVTGVIIDMPAVARIMQRFGGKVFFDCAAYASHCALDMNPVDGDGLFGQEEGAYGDGIFLSPHKFVGGPG